MFVNDMSRISITFHIRAHFFPLLLFRNIEAADSLIETLAERESSKSVHESEDSSAEVGYNNAVKHPKSDLVVIEELRTLNSKLRELITQILIQLEASQKESKTLRTRLEKYEPTTEKKVEAKAPGEQNLIDFNSMSSSGESVGNIP